jgi:hypothetical protein
MSSSDIASKLSKFIAETIERWEIEDCLEVSVTSGISKKGSEVSNIKDYIDRSGIGLKNEAQMMMLYHEATKFISFSYLCQDHKDNGRFNLDREGILRFHTSSDTDTIVGYMDNIGGSSMKVPVSELLIIKFNISMVFHGDRSTFVFDDQYDEGSKFINLCDLIDPILDEIRDNPTMFLESSSNSNPISKSNWLDSVNSEMPSVPNPEGRNFLF